MDFYFRLKQLLSGGQHSTNVSTAYSRSFSPEIRYFFLPYTKYASEKLPFSSAKSLAECSPPIYAVLPETKKGPCIQSMSDGHRGLVIIYMISVMLLFFQRTQKSPGTSFTMLRGRGEVDTDWSFLQNIHVWMQQNRQSVINWRKMCRHKAEITAYQCSKSNKLFEKRKWLQKSERKSDFWSQNI